MIYFLDTNALAKRYLERGSNSIRRLLERKENIFYQSFPTPLEVASALYRRLRSGEISPAELSFLLRAYVAHCHEDYLLIAHHVLRALDAVQVASALVLRDSLPVEAHPLTGLSADDGLLDAARAEHLQAENPESWR